MSTIIDLNTATTVTFNNQADYAIVFGANAGNTTANVDAYASANITKQTSLTSITDAVRDLLIDVEFSNVGAVSMAYTGSYSNIGLLQIAPAAWRVNGIRSVDQYDEAFANVRYTDLSGGFSTNPDYSYITTVNDQSGNTRAWTTNVNAIAQPTLSVTGNVVYNEDTLTNVTVANVLVDPGSVVTFRLYANTVSTYGSMSDGVVTGSSIYIDGNAASLNSQIAAGGIKFLPASDFTSNVANAINFSLGNITSEFSTANANIQIGTTHNEYNFPSTGTYDEDTRYSFGNTISDLDTRATSFTVDLLQTSGNIGQWYRNSILVGNANVLLQTTGSRESINNTIQWMPPLEYTGNVSFTYNQIKTLPSGNVTQASNVVANFTGISNPEISNMINRSYTSNTVNNIFSTSTPYINDGGDYGQTYTITLSSSIGKFGNSAPNAIAASSYSYSGNITQVNNEFSSMVFVPNPGSASTGTFTYTQARDGVGQVNVSPTLTGTNGNITPGLYEFASSGTFTPTFNEYYFGNARIMMVGGGGRGGAISTYNSGGGGSGAVSNRTFQNGTAYYLRDGTHTITIGSAGTSSNAGDGTATSITYNGLTLDQALGGKRPITTPFGGDGGGGTSGGDGTSFAGGGGGGVSTSGTSGSGSSVSNGIGGNGGSGGYLSLTSISTPDPAPGQTVSLVGGGGGGDGSSINGNGGGVGGNAFSNATGYGGGGGAGLSSGSPGYMVIYIR